jgi:hypothetical protein
MFPNGSRRYLRGGAAAGRMISLVAVWERRSPTCEPEYDEVPMI